MESKCAICHKPAKPSAGVYIITMGSTATFILEDVEGASNKVHSTCLDEVGQLLRGEGPAFDNMVRNIRRRVHQLTQREMGMSHD